MSLILNFKTLSQDIIDNTKIIINVNSNSEDTKNTVKDSRLGETKNIICSTCNESKISGCNGHSGKIKMNNSVAINPAFADIVNKVLKYYCPVCFRLKNIKLDELANEYNTILMDNNNEENKQSKKIKADFIKLLNIKQNKCLNKNCNLTSSGFKITKDYKIQAKVNGDLIIIEKEKIYEMLKLTSIPVARLITKNNENVNTLPNLFFADNYYIPSNFIRDTNTYDDVSSNVHTTQLNKISAAIMSGSSKKNELQTEINRFDNSKHVSAYKKQIAIETLSDQVNGTTKDGILRSSIFGRRLDNSGRAVLGASIEADIGTCKVSSKILDNLSYRIYYNYITSSYIEHLLKNDINKIKKIVIVKEEDQIEPNKQLIIKEGLKLDFLQNLKFGDYIEIVKPDNTYINFSRQPSLHLWNNASGIVSRIDTSTTKLPIAIEASQNGDNDGDTNSILNQRNPSSNIETGFMMNSRIIAKNPANQSIMYGLVQDQIIAIHKVYKLKNISKYKAFNLMRKYSILIKDDKNNYTGQELLSYFIKDNITLDGYFDNGKIILKELISSHVTAQSYGSIFNMYSQIATLNDAVTLIDQFKYVANNYITQYGYSVKASEILSKKNNFNDNHKFVLMIVNTINKNIEKYINDAKDNKILITSKNDINYLKQLNIDMLQSILLERVNNDSYLKEDNSLNDMTNVGYKRSKDEIIKTNYSFGQQGDIDISGIYSRNTAYELPGDISIQASGYIIKALLNGLEFNDYVYHVARNSMVKLINVTCGTATSGILGKKIVKATSNLIVNYRKEICDNSNIISPCANFLKINGIDIVKIDLLYDQFDDNSQWNTEQINTFNIIKPFLIVNNQTELVTKLLFYYNIDAFIKTYNNTHNNLEEVNYDEILIKLNSFLEYLDVIYNNNLNLNFIKYIILSYCNKNRLVKYNNILSDTLFDEIIYKIKYLIKYSLGPGETIGLKYGNSVQESITQQTLSSFHTKDKNNRAIKSNALSKFKECIQLSMIGKTDQITIFSTNKDKLIKYKNIFEYSYLQQYLPNYSINIYPTIDNNFEHEISIIIKRTALNSKNITVQRYFKLYENILNNLKYILNYYYYIRLNDNDIEIIINMNLLPEYINNLDLIWFTLQTQVSNGKYMNENLIITEISKYDRDLNQINLYQLSLYIDNNFDLLIIDTDDEDISIDLNIWHSYLVGGIVFSKYRMLEELLNIGDGSLFLPYKLIVDYIYRSYKPTSIGTLLNKNNVIKSVAHGDSNALVKSSFYNLTDNCKDLYSRILTSQKILYGTGYFNFLINPNIFNNYYYEEKINEKQEIINDIISIL